MVTCWVSLKLEITLAHGGNLIQSGHKGPTSVQSRGRGARAQWSAAEEAEGAAWCRGCRRDVGHFPRGGWSQIRAEGAWTSSGESGSSIPGYCPRLTRIQQQQSLRYIPHSDKPQKTSDSRTNQAGEVPKAVVILDLFPELPVCSDEASGLHHFCLRGDILRPQLMETEAETCAVPPSAAKLCQQPTF